MKRPIGQCSLCFQEGKELQSSHAIPNAIFKPILAMNNGAGIAIHQDMKVATHYSGDSWKEHRLCRDCESKLNNAYENKAIGLIRREKELAHYCEDGLSISRTDLGRLRSFFVSVFWRASVWSHEAFKHFHLPNPISEDIRKQLLTGGVVSSQLIGVRLLTLRDATFGFPEAEPFQQMICNPFHRKTPSGMMLVCCFGGFLIEAKLGGYRGKEREYPGVLNNGVRPMIAPWCNFSDVPELLQMGIISLHKETVGHSKLKNQALSGREAESSLLFSAAVPPEFPPSRESLRLKE